MTYVTACSLCFGLATAVQLLGQAVPEASASGKDVLLLVNGEKLIGHLKHASDTSVVFQSDSAGEVTVKWTVVQELRSSDKFAAIPKGVKLRSSEDTARVPQGSVSATSQSVEVKTAQGTAQSTPTSGISNIIDEASFQRAFRRTSFVRGWKGGATAGLALTQATQNSRTFTAAVNLVRSAPSETWLDARNRTILGFNEAYGKLSQPGTPDVKTSLYHLGLEQDRYLSSRLYVFGQAALDHSFSQGLKLQQVYGGGLGFVLFKDPKQELDFKASMDYIDQRFETPGLNKSLIGSMFGETYTRTFAHSILLSQQAGITPAWNDTSAYSAFTSAALTFPVYHRFGLTMGALDNFLNNPPPGFKKNSFQFTAGATYSLP